MLYLDSLALIVRSNIVVIWNAMSSLCQKAALALSFGNQQAGLSNRCIQVVHLLALPSKLCTWYMQGGGGGGKKAEGKAQIHWLKQTSVTSSAEYWWCQLRLPKLNWSPLGLEASVHGVAFRPLLSFKESSRWHRFSQESGFHLTSLVVFLMM